MRPSAFDDELQAEVDKEIEHMVKKRKKRTIMPPISDNLTDEELMIVYIDLVDRIGWVKAQKRLLQRKVDVERIRDTEQRALDFGYTYRSSGKVLVDYERWGEVC